MNPLVICFSTKNLQTTDIRQGLDAVFYVELLLATQPLAVRRTKCSLEQSHEYRLAGLKNTHGNMSDLE